MRKRFMVIAVVLFLLPGVFASGAEKKVYDRAALEGYIDKYLDAMKDNNPSLDLFTRDCKFTENGIQLPLGGEGLWYSMADRANYSFYVPDIETRQVAFIGTVKEQGRPSRNGQPAKDIIVAVAIRLKIDDNGKICEAEQLAIRPETSLFEVEKDPAPSTGDKVEAMGKPHPVFFEVIPENERMSREELVEVGNYYFEGLQRNDGKGYYPFTDDCVRFENGNDVLLQTNPATGEKTRMTCKKQFEESLRGIVTRIRDRRFVAVDRERGIVFAFGFFDHLSINWTWQLAELFKVEKGNISRIEAIFLRGAYGINSGWSTYQQGMSEEAQSIR